MNFLYDYFQKSYLASSKKTDFVLRISNIKIGGSFVGDAGIVATNFIIATYPEIIRLHLSSFSCNS